MWTTADREIMAYFGIARLYELAPMLVGSAMQVVGETLHVRPSSEELLTALQFFPKEMLDHVYPVTGCTQICLWKGSSLVQRYTLKMVPKP